MRYRTYPGTDISVSEVGFGTWTVSAGWWGDFTDEEAIKLLRHGPRISASPSSTLPTATGTGEPRSCSAGPSPKIGTK